MLTNTILTFNKRTVDNYAVSDYSSIDFVKLRTYFSNLDPLLVDSIHVDDDDRFERISNDIYGNADYWDVLMLLNDRHPLTGLPFSFDSLSALADDKVVEFENLVYQNNLNVSEYENMYNSFEKSAVDESESKRIIKIIRPASMSTFIQDAKSKGIF